MASRKILFEIRIPVAVAQIDDLNTVAFGKYADGAITVSEVPAVRDVLAALNDYRVMKHIVAAVETAIPLPEVKSAQKYEKIDVGPASVVIESISALAPPL